MLVYASIISFVMGFISLSLEILWFSVFSFGSGGRAGIFGLVLSFVLFGIAFGSKYSQRLLLKFGMEPLQFISRILVCAAVLNYLSLPVGVSLMTSSGAAGFLMLFSLFFTFALLGIIFPILCEYGRSETTAVGKSVSWVYFSNIVGASIGPLFTGYVLLNIFSISTLMVSFSALLLIFAVVIDFFFVKQRSNRFLSVSAVGCILCFILMNYFYVNIPEKLYYKEQYSPDKLFSHIIQTKSGMITVEKSPDGDIIYGGGIYDGRFSVDPVLNSNGIRRAYLFSALHPNPKRVLEIGLSSGSWLKVLSSFPSVEKSDVIEINPGYKRIIKAFPIVSDVLSNPNITIRIDDGRRWLNLNPAEKYDLIMMNTSFHFRENITNLLSREFLELAQDHLNPGGFIGWNPTGSAACIATAASVFKYVMVYEKFVIASDTPFTSTPAQIESRLKSHPIYDSANDALKSVFRTMSHVSLRNLQPLYKGRNYLIITDDNMLTEYKF